MIDIIINIGKKSIKEKKEIITCECGATLKRGNLWNHRKLSKTHRRNMKQINNINEEINNNVNVTNKPKKEYKFTEKRKLKI